MNPTPQKSHAQPFNATPREDFEALSPCPFSPSPGTPEGSRVSGRWKGWGEGSSSGNFSLDPPRSPPHPSHPRQPTTFRTDTETQSLLNDIDKSPAAPASSTATPSHSNKSSRWALLQLFAPALITAAAAGIAGSILGVFVLLRREALMALAIPQIVAVGAAIGMRNNWPTLPPALVAAAGGMIYFAASKRWGAASIVLPSLYIGGLSLSFLIIANAGQHVADLQNLFTGIDVAVSWTTAQIAAPILLIAAISCALLWRRWLLLAQAPAAAELAGLRPARWDALFLSLLTLVLLLGTSALGVVMILAMLFLPAATVLPWTRRIPATLLAAALLSLVFLTIGFAVSNQMSWPLSQSVGCVGFTALLLSHLVRVIRIS